MPPSRLLADDAARALLADGLAAIRAEGRLPTAFPPDVAAAAEAAAATPPPAGARDDLRAAPFATLDPLGSRDLDQAFLLEADGADLVLRYAIADVAARVVPDGPLDREAWARGTTVYLPDGKVPLYPTALSEGAASLLPQRDTPAIVLVVRIGPEGEARLDDARPSLVRSQAQLAYETVEDAELPALLAEAGRRGALAEARRGAMRIDLADQEVVADPAATGGLRVALRPRRPVEDWNACLSLAANLAVARTMVDHGVGLLRVMPGPDADELARLRHTATGLGIAWPADEPLRALVARLDPCDRAEASFLRAARRTNGGASYATVADGVREHAAIGAVYAHATAPLRRLADRYVLEVVRALAAGTAPPAEIVEALPGLPRAMARAETAASRAERAAVDLVEAVELAGRVGETFAATVIDADDEGARIQLQEPPVRARIRGAAVEPGARIDVRLEAADPAKRSLRFAVS